MNNNENYDKLILFTKNLSYDKKADDLGKIRDEIVDTVLPYIENANDLVHSKFLTPKDLNETFSFPKGNIDLRLSLHLSKIIFVQNHYS